MEYRIERKVTFIEEGYIEADSVEDLKEKLKTAQLEWNVDFEFNPEIEAVIAYDEEDEMIELPADIMEEDFVGGMNGCLIFNQEEFDRYNG